MERKTKKMLWFLGLLLLVLLPTLSFAQSDKDVSFFPNARIGVKTVYWFIILPLIAVILFFAFKISQNVQQYLAHKRENNKIKFDKYVQDMNSQEIDVLKKYKTNKIDKKVLSIILIGFLSVLSSAIMAQTPDAVPAKRETLFSEPGVIIVLIMVLIPILVGVLLFLAKIKNNLNSYFNKEKEKEAKDLAQYLANTDNIPDEAILLKLKERFDYILPEHPLSGNNPADDTRGLVENVRHDHNLHLFAQKIKPIKRPKIDPELTKLILAFIGSAIFWLVLGTTIGEYAGIKFVTPDADTVQWLSFGILRAMHTNIVFWAWGTIGIMALGYYVVPIVSNAPLYSIKLGWRAFYLVNIGMILGPITLAMGINNGGGEYREYIWPIMGIWAGGLILTLYNFIKTVAQRTTKEVYISNWFVVGAYIFILIVAILSYLPFGQNGIGEVIMQGYYMHQAVGMWFMFSNLGFLYYFLPQQLNKPIYSYSLGVLAFWTQILFYTLIGTHHYVFSSLPWWLQTIAIVGSAGMLIPVTAGTVNYLMTFKGSWRKVSSSYSLPFFLVGVIYYFTGSFQGTAEAFRTTNLIWHFTDFTIAHSHITMYGIITFLLFGGIYAIVPRLTGNEPPQLGVGAHFWLALVGLQFYTIPLMIGGTLKGLSWAEGKPFIDSVVLMAPYWLWRAIGGSLMWLSHLVFAYNFYKMVSKKPEIDIKAKAIEILKAETV